MDKQEQRIAIAEACGWKQHDHPDVAHLFVGWQTAGKWICDPEGVPQFLHSIPDYLNDLNAMHEAEKVLSDEQYEKYRQIVVQINFDSPSPIRVMCPITATATQRAEAFLKTLNLWNPSSSHTSQAK